MVTKHFSNRDMPEHGEKTSSPDKLAESATPARLGIKETIANCINRRISLDQEWRRKMEKTNTQYEAVLNSLQGGSERRTALLEEISRKLDRLNDIDRKLDRLNGMSAKLNALDASFDRLDSGLNRVVNDGVDRVLSRPAETAPTITSHPRTDAPVEEAAAGQPTKIDTKPDTEAVQPARSVPSPRNPPDGDKETGTRWPKLIEAFNQRRRGENAQSVRRHRHEGKLLPLYDISARDPKQLPDFPPTARAFLELDHDNVSRLLKSLHPDAQTRPEWGQMDWMQAALAALVGGTPLHDFWLEQKSDEKAAEPVVACDSDQAQEDEALVGCLSFLDTPIKANYSDLLLWLLVVFLVGYVFAILEQVTGARR